MTAAILRKAALCALGALAVLTGCSSRSAVPGTSIPAADGAAIARPLWTAAVPAGTWTFLADKDTRSEDGSTMGIGLNPGTANELVIYFDGGGECWNTLTCELLQTAAGGPFDASTLAQEVRSYGPSWILSRTLPGNPFARASFALVPYRTGDDHGGNKIARYTRATKPVKYYHFGRTNVVEDLRRLAERFRAPAKVVVVGSDAGGYGALFNYEAIRQTWPKAAGYLIDDSGPPLEAGVTPQSQWVQMFGNWGIGAILDPLCTCRNGWSPALAALATKYPRDRISLLSYERDTVVPSFYGMQASAFPAALNALAAGAIAPHANVKYYFVGAGEGHVLLGDPAAFDQGVNLLSWLGEQVGDSAAWKSEHP